MRAIYNYFLEFPELNQPAQSTARHMMSISDRSRRVLLSGSLFLVAVLISCVILFRHGMHIAQTSAKPGTAKKNAAAKPAMSTPGPRSAALQTHRNIGKAFYEQ